MSPSPVHDALDAVTAAHLGDGDLAAAEDELADQLRGLLVWSDLEGAASLLAEADDLEGTRAYQESRPVAWESDAPEVQRVDFWSAIEALLDREPRLASTAEEAMRIYDEEYGFTLASASSEQVLEHVQNAIASAMLDGATRDQARQQLLDAAEGEGWTNAYADNVWRTNSASGYLAGRVREARSPEIRSATPGFRFQATLDSDVRPNHAAAHGFVAHQDDPVWADLTPPLGFNCRCNLALVTRRELVAAGAISPDGEAIPQRPPQDAGADPGFAAQDPAAIP